MIPLTNAAGDATVSSLLAGAWDWRTLEEGTLCETCAKEKDMQDKSFFEKHSDIIYFAFPRGSGTMTDGRARTNRRKLFAQST